MTRQPRGPTLLAQLPLAALFGLVCFEGGGRANGATVPRSRFRTGLLVVALVVTGCSGAPEQRPPVRAKGLDLVAEVEHAVVRHAWGSFAFADPRNRSAMQRGWRRDVSPAKERPEAHGGVWAIGDVSSFEAFLPESKDRRLTLVARRSTLAGSTIRVSIDGRPLGEVETGELPEGRNVELAIGSSGAGRLSLEAAGAERTGVTLVQPRLLGVADASFPPATRASAASTEVVSTEVASAEEGLEASPPIFLYVIDTLRADHLGVYGYDRETSPNIDRFAEEAVVFENAFSQSAWTRAAIASILTGLLPPAHGAVDDTDVLPEGVVTLGERLGDAGYATAAVTANGNVSAVLGFRQGFDSFDYVARTEDGFLARSQQVHEAAMAWIDEQAKGVPLFVWTLTIDPHAPYSAPEPFYSRFSDRPFDRDAGAVSRLRQAT